jgi:hypothetical protein
MLIRLISLVTAILLTACSMHKSLPAAPVVHITVSVDWEGREMSDENLAAFATLRQAHPSLPLTHFLNAAYFCKDGALADDVRDRMRSVLKDRDELGLHIHPWKSLAESAGVTFRSGPTIWGVERPERKGWPDPGHDVSVEAYEVDEFQKLVAHSKDLLESNGFKLSNSFRAGAWLAGPRVLEAVRREGFLIDSSATDTKWHTKIAQYALPQMIRDLWPNVTSDTQPFYITTPAGEILEMPDTGALADYVTAEQMAEHILDVVSKLDGADRYAHIGFHQETAANYIQRVTDALNIVNETCAEQVVFETLEQARRSLF